MKSIVRRPRGSLVITVRITLQKGVDDELIKILENVEQGNLAKTIKNLMKNGYRQEDKEFEEDEDIDLSGLGKEI